MLDRREAQPLVVCLPAAQLLQSGRPTNLIHRRAVGHAALEPRKVLTERHSIPHMAVPNALRFRFVFDRFHQVDRCDVVLGRRHGTYIPHRHVDTARGTAHRAVLDVGRCVQQRLKVPVHCLIR